MTSRFPTRALRVSAWAVAILIPVFVASSRMYRGMHHPLDVAGGLVVGIGALLVLLFACRAAGVAHQARSPAAAKSPRAPGAAGRMKVAVVAHAEKTLGGGLPELRRVLEAAGVEEPLWYEVPKAKKAPEQVRRALDEGAELVFAWGGDGTVRRCIDVLAGTKASLAVLPAGTANLFATNLGIPKDIERAVAVGLRGDRRRLDVGRFGKERFAVMAGAGFDAAMIRDADDLKERIGRAAYLWSGSRNLRGEGFGAEIEVDGADWYEGRRRASCSATSATSSAASRCSPTPGRTTACSSSAS